MTLIMNKAREKTQNFYFKNKLESSSIAWLPEETMFDHNMEWEDGDLSSLYSPLPSPCREKKVSTTCSYATYSYENPKIAKRSKK